MADRTKSSADPNNRQAVDLTDPDNLLIAGWLLQAESFLVEAGISRIQVARAMLGMATGTLLRETGREQTQRDLKDNQAAFDAVVAQLKIN